MLVAVVGGRLQGVEAAYLARKAGWNVLIFDKDDYVPARELGQAFFNLNVTACSRIKDYLKEVDLIIPALENIQALSVLSDISDSLGIPLALDPAAYRISSSKILSNEVFAHLGLPLPRPWPQCGLPVLAKPDGKSGSEGVRMLSSLREVTSLLEHTPHEEAFLLQEYLPGPSFSLEVMGRPGEYSALQITDLFMDRGYDCKRVSAPSELSVEQCVSFKKLGIAIAQEINLRGLMDIEVILHEGQLKLLEIDARLPSQTPSAVFWSSGFNMVKAMGDLFLGKWEPVLLPENPGHAIYEHIKVTPDTIEVTGEHVMAHAGPLQVVSGFWGADEALTDYRPNKASWVATMIHAGSGRNQVQARRDRTLLEICRSMKISTVQDESPNPGLITGD